MLRLVLSVKQSESNVIYKKKSGGVDEMRTLDKILLFSFLFFLYLLTELNQTTRTFFPKEYLSRKQTFQKANCAKWPLPSCRKLFRIFGSKFENGEKT